jgi:hypothetical protein
MICTLCNKNETTSHPKFCDKCIAEIRESFHYGIGGKEISKSEYDAIIKRGYVIPEEMDKDRHD